MERKPVFLRAEWRDLVMLNYEADPALLRPHVPAGTELDAFEGKTYMSLVGFRFCRTKLFGKLPVPLHGEFEEVNLRFYVRREVNGESRRGVVFLAEIVPKWAVAATARLVYGENYVCLPMRHRIECADSQNQRVAGAKKANGETETGLRPSLPGTASKRGAGRYHESQARVQEIQSPAAKYEFRLRGEWCRLWARGEGEAAEAREGSVEQFITEHYWGYTQEKTGAQEARARHPKAGAGGGHKGSLEYHVAHVPWKVWITEDAGFEGDGSALYGVELARVIRRKPDSAFLAEGSEVTVYRGENFG
jgi:hypothetical protein